MGAAPEMIGIAADGEATMMGAAPEMIGIAEAETTIMITIMITIITTIMTITMITTRPVIAVGH
jgi:hypothetical protein